MKLFLDTSMLLGFLSGDKDFKPTAERLLAMKLLGDAELWTSARAYLRAHTLLSQVRDEDEILQAFLASFEELQVCSLDGDDIRRASELHHEDFEDCLTDLAAQRVKADILLTRRSDGYEDATSIVMVPEDFFEELAAGGVSYSI